MKQMNNSWIGETYLLGAGGHGRVVLDTLLLNEVPITGILDAGFEKGEQVFGIPVLGGNEILAKMDGQTVKLFNGVGLNPSLSKRKNIFLSMKDKNFAFLSVQHPSAVLGRECILEEGCQIMANVVLQPRVKVGCNSVVNTSASIDHDCTIGEHTFIAPGVILCGQVQIGNQSFIGAGAVILPGVKVGSASVIGAGAIVTKSIPDQTVVAGNPAVKIGNMNLE